MEEILAVALEAAAGGEIRAVDARILRPARFESLTVRNGVPTVLTSGRSSGIGVRVRTERAWGFATTDQLTRAEVRRTSRQAVRLALGASRTTRETLPLTPEVGPAAGEYASELRIDPFEVSQEEKIQLLAEAERALHVDPAIKVGEASLHLWQEEKWFASSEGSSFHSKITHVGAGICATAVRGREVQRRSAPTSFGGDFAQTGYGFIRELHLAERAPQVGREAAALLDAPAPPEGLTTLVLGSDQLALQVHESIGHATEADRMLAFEAGYAGTSWVEPSSIGRLEYGSPLLRITADATVPHGLGTFGFDDEGLPARRVPIIEAGHLAGVESSRESAGRMGLPASSAAMRADGYARTPLVRMTNVNLLPGDASFAELLEGVTDGIYLETNRSWSIDDKRLNFQFGTEIGRRIIRGELGPLVRNPIYSGMTPRFWGSLDRVGNPSTYHLWGLPNCGKGQPGQAAHVGHGAPAARFRNVRVSVAK